MNTRRFIKWTSWPIIHLHHARILDTENNHSVSYSLDSAVLFIWKREDSFSLKYSEREREREGKREREWEQKRSHASQDLTNLPGTPSFIRYEIISTWLMYYLFSFEIRVLFFPSFCCRWIVRGRKKNWINFVWIMNRPTFFLLRF